MPQARAFLLSLFWTAAAGTAPVWAQAPASQCPAEDAPALIEVLPFTHTGNTCDGFKDIVSSYGGACRIQRATYSGPDAIYKVRLNPGNQRVTFHLEMEGPSDLVLALLRQCGQGTTCVNSSPDYIGSQAEEFSAAPGSLGIYYLVVDSAEDLEGHCGAYTLTVTGVNPTPDLVLELTGSPQPVVAGEVLTYTMTIANAGALEATDVRVTQPLPAGVTLLRASSGCTSTEKGKVVCSLDRLAIGAQATWQTTVKVSPAARGVLGSTATARATEGDPTLSNNERTVTTRVIARSDLSIEKSPSRDSVIAGGPQSLVYTLRVRNSGPSDAARAEVTDALRSDVDFVSAPGCTEKGGKVTCGIGRLAAGGSIEKKITVRVKPSARELLENTARVDALEAGLEEINPANNAATRTTRVIRRTNLSVTKTGPASVAAGEKLTYKILVENRGPSDSTGATVTDALPPGVCMVQTDGCAQGMATFSTGPIPRGGKKELSFQARVDSSLRQPAISNSASLAPLDPREQDPNGLDNTSRSDASVTIEADLELVDKTAVPVSDLADPGSDPVAAGENLLYTLTVRNNGPSDSRGGIITDPLTSNLRFVSSPDGCQAKNGVVSCPVPPLAANDGSHGCASSTPTNCFRFVVKVSADAAGAIDNRASVEGLDGDPKPDNNARSSIPTAVQPEADLAVFLSGSSNLVSGPGELTYTLTVANAGPSDAEDVKAVLELPEGVSPSVLAPDCTASAGGTGFVVECLLGNLRAGASPLTLDIRVDVLPIPASHSATATARVSSATPEPDSPAAQSNNTAAVTTILAASNDADLTIKKSAHVPVLPTGAPLHYTLVVSNKGPAKATRVRVEDHLPGGIFFPNSECASLESGNLVVWTVGDLDKDAVQRCTFTVIMTGTGSFTNVANVTSQDVGDPDPSNNTSQVTTLTLGGFRPPTIPSLILPYFEADRDPAGVATLFAVRNPANHPVCVRYDYFLAGQQGPERSEMSCVASKALDTRNLRDLQLGDEKVAVGYVDATPVSCLECSTIPCAGCAGPTAVDGDFFRIDPSRGSASGELLLSTDPTRRPPDLCERWDGRFLNGGSSADSTEVVFFVPNNRAGSDPIATGKVYSEAGDFIQPITIDTSEKAFHRTTEDLLASAGAIEWTFRKDVIGNVTTVHRAGGDAVAVPGVCRRPPSGQDLGDEAPLLLPYFAVDRSNGATTLFAVRNGTDREVQVHYEYLSANGSLQLGETKPLAGREMRTVNLRDIPQLTTGSVRITVVPDPAVPERREQILSGDYIRLGPAAPQAQSGRAAGSALVDTDPQRSPRQLCHRWDARFIQNANTGQETGFVFFLDSPTSGVVATGKVYRKNGNYVKTIQVEAPPGSLLAAFERSASELGVNSGEGSIEWDLGPLGNVATVFKRGAGLDSVLVPGVCRE